MYYIYIYLNPRVNGIWSYKEFNFKFQLIYVGMGVGDRWKVHLRITKSMKKKESNYTKFNLIESLILSNTPPIIIKLFENISRDNAKLIEKEIIKHFGKLIDHTGILTNITDGADETRCNRLGKENPQSKKVYQYSLNGEFIKEWDCLREIGRIIGKPYNTIGDVCRGKTKTAHGYQWSYNFCNKLDFVKRNDRPSRHKMVYKFDLDGMFIESYVSLIDACKKNNARKTNLSKCILDRVIYQKYFYSYDNVFDPNKPKHNTYNKIFHNGEYIYLTNNEIMIKFNVSRSYLYYVKNGKLKDPKFIIEN